MNAFTELLRSGETPVVPTCYDPFSARLAEHFGFKAVSISGYDQGAVSCVTEPLLTATEVVDAATRVRRAVGIPILVDAGAGFGEPMHVVRMIEDMVQAGIEAVHIEDQVYPKRAHYLRDYVEDTVTAEEFTDKIRWAKKTGGDAMAVIARTDAYKTHGAQEVIARAHAALDAGADAIIAFPNTMAEAQELPAKAGGPVLYVNTHGNRVGRPMLTQAQARDFGYAMLIEAHVFLFAAFDAMRAIAGGHSPDRLWTVEDSIGTRKRIEEVLNVQRLWDIEAETVETG